MQSIITKIEIILVDGFILWNHDFPGIYFPIGIKFISIPL